MRGMHRNFASMPPRPLPPPGVSYDGRSQTSKFWGPKSHKVIMCPHVRSVADGGGQCGLTAEHCMCVCMLCSSTMRARKRCGRIQPDGKPCPWGEDRSPEVSSPEQSPERPQRKRPRAWWRGPAPAAAAGPAPPAAAGPAPSDETPPPAAGPAPSDDTFLSLPNLEPGGPDAPMPSAPALGAQYYNTTPRRRPKAVKAARARDDYAIFDLDEELLADFVAPPPPCHPPKPQGE